MPWPPPSIVISSQPAPALCIASHMAGIARTPPGRPSSRGCTGRAAFLCGRRRSARRRAASRGPPRPVAPRRRMDAAAVGRVPVDAGHVEALRMIAPQLQPAFRNRPARRNPPRRPPSSPASRASGVVHQKAAGRFADDARSSRHPRGTSRRGPLPSGSRCRRPRPGLRKADLGRQPVVDAEPRVTRRWPAARTAAGRWCSCCLRRTRRRGPEWPRGKGPGRRERAGRAAAGLPPGRAYSTSF